MTDTKKLAETLNVSETDLMCLAQSVANSIEKDGAADVALQNQDTFGVEIVKAYIPVAAKKYDTFVSTYLTNPDAANSFKQSVLSI
jgi:galactose-1-phosphate uridylyltransferase